MGKKSYTLFFTKLYMELSISQHYWTRNISTEFTDSSHHSVVITDLSTAGLPWSSLYGIKWCTTKCCDFKFHKEAFIYDTTYLLLFDILQLYFNMIGVLCNSVYFVTCVYSKRYPEKGSIGFFAQLQNGPWHKCPLPLTHRLWPEQRSPHTARPRLLKVILPSWCVLLFSCVPLFSKNTSWEDTWVRRPMWRPMDPSDTKSSPVPMWATLDNQPEAGHQSSVSCLWLMGRCVKMTDAELCLKV